MLNVKKKTYFQLDCLTFIASTRETHLLLPEFVAALNVRFYNATQTKSKLNLLMAKLKIT